MAKQKLIPGKTRRLPDTFGWHDLCFTGETEEGRLMKAAYAERLPAGTPEPEVMLVSRHGGIDMVWGISDADFAANATRGARKYALLLAVLADPEKLWVLESEYDVSHLRETLAQ